MLIAFILFLHILPERESMVYQTNDKGKLGSIFVVSQLNDNYHIVYTSDRIIRVILDTVGLGTLRVEKTVDGKLELQAWLDEDFHVQFRGNRYRYREKDFVYDRHTLDFALRGFLYYRTFKKTIRLHVPEFMIVNAELRVIGDDVVSGPLGDIACWKLEMKPRILFINWKFYFWIEKAYPHRFVKYEDSSGENSIMLAEYTRACGI